MSNILRYLIILIMSFVLHTNKFGQDFLSILKPENIEYLDEELVKAPNIAFGGLFEFNYLNQNKSFFGKKKGTYSTVNGYLDIRTSVISQASFNMRISGAPGFSGSNTTGAYHYYSMEERSADLHRLNKSDIFSSMLIEQIYLEYRHNPLAKIRIGRQPILIGDKEGIVYKSNNLAITMSCAIGTWCYAMGIGYPGEHNKSGTLTFFEVNYPLYDDEIEIDDGWGKLNSRNRFDIGSYWIGYNYTKTAVAEYGGTTREPDYRLDVDQRHSMYQAKNSNDNYVFRDINWSYWGFNLDFQFYPIRIKSKIIVLSGKSNFYEETAKDAYALTRKNSKNDAFAFFLDFDWRINKNNKIKLAGFISSGNKSNDPVYNMGTDRNFYQINKGTYGEANIYFADSHSVGLRHSLSNLSFLNTTYDFQLILGSFGKIGYQFDFYALFKTNPILNFEGKRVNTVGFEIDNEIFLSPVKDLKFSVSYSMFIAGKAYADNDSMIPQSNKSKIDSQINLKANYKF